jgi:hypothetical protein
VITKGPNFKSLGLALLVILFGAGLIGAGVLKGSTLAIGSLALPSWTIYALGGVALLIGIGVGAMSLNAEKCGQCGTHLDYGEAYFPLEFEAQVMHAANAVDASQLVSAPMVPKNQMKMALEMDYCPNCGQVGRYEVTKWQDFEPHAMLPSKVVSGPNVAAFAQMINAHKEFRGEDDDD